MTASQQSLSIDFVAYHHLQAQAAESVFAELSKRHKCRWLIGPDQIPTGAEAAVILDHRAFQPRIRKDQESYRYLFHLSHDLGDIAIYSDECLADIDIVFVPTKTHQVAARSALGPDAKIIVAGWPKFDRISILPDEDFFRRELGEFPHQFTVIFAPTWPNTWEWQTILPLLFALPVNVIIKNHIIVNPGQPFPQGQEDLYRECIRSVDEMEKFASSANRKGVLVAPRSLNICSLFPYSQMLISDASSCTLEFLPFGISIETGIKAPGTPLEFSQPEASLLSPEVHFVPLAQLKQVLASVASLEEFVRHHRENKPTEPFIAYDPQKSAGKTISMDIITFLENIEQEYQQGRAPEPNQNMLNPLLGFDPCGEVFTCQGRVLRGIFAGHGQRALKLYERCVEADLFNAGVVKTSICADKSLLHLGYDLVLEHERVPFITYAHEWPTEMFQDAALFQIDLSLKLARFDLWLKDCGVQSNVLFNSTSPVFVDFLSLCSAEELEDQEFLKPQIQRSAFSPLWSRRSVYFNEIYERMFYPYFLYPLYMQHQRRHADTRKRLLATALNTCFEVITSQEAFEQADQNQIQLHQRALAAREHSLITDDWTQFMQILRDEIADLQPETVRSAYTSYYDLKNENYDFQPSAAWGQKQRTVYYSILALNPRTVLDVGANTGWFSILAAKLGCQVVSLDVDEASMNVLYRTAKSQELPILPLVMDIANLPGDVAPFPGYEQDEHMLQSRLTTSAPLLLSAEKRLQCDMVLALAIVHHLCLGLGLDLADLIGRLASFATKHLVLEFVAKEDKLVVAEPEFFPAYHKNPHLFDWYSQDNLTLELKKHFSRIETTESSAGRILLICSR